MQDCECGGTLVVIHNRACIDQIRWRKQWWVIGVGRFLFFFIYIIIRPLMVMKRHYVCVFLFMIIILGRPWKNYTSSLFIIDLFGTLLALNMIMHCLDFKNPKQGFLRIIPCAVTSLQWDIRIMIDLVTCVLTRMLWVIIDEWKFVSNIITLFTIFLFS